MQTKRRDLATRSKPQGSSPPAPRAAGEREAGAPGPTPASRLPLGRQPLERCWWAVLRRLPQGWLLGWTLAAAPAWAGDLYGGASDLPTELRGLLQATDPARRREGVERLEGLEPRLATPYLIQRLADGDAGVRARAAQGLALAAAIDAAPLLLDCLSDAEPPVRVACADAVGQFGALPRELQTRAAATLGRALGDTQYEVRTEVLRALGRMLRAQALRKEDVGSLLGPVLLRVEDENVGVRRAAAAVLGRLGSLTLPKELMARVSVALLGQLSDTARDVRAEALASLGELRTAAAAPAALRMLRDPTDEVRRQAVLCLGRLQYAGAVPALVELLESSAEPLRGSAAAALGQITRAEAGARPEQLAAAQAALSELVRGLEREDLRALARDALLAAGPVAIPALCARLQQAGGQVEIGAAVELLRDLASAASGEQRTVIVKALTAELWRRRVPREQVLEALTVLHDRATAPLCAGLLSDRDAAVRRQALLALRQPGMLDERASDAVLAATRDADSEVRLQATYALGEIGSQAAQDRLAELLRGSGPPGAKVSPELRPPAELRAAAALALGRAAQARPAVPLAEAAWSALLAAVAAPAESAGAAASTESGRRMELAEQRVRRAAANALTQAVVPSPGQKTALAAALLAALRKARGDAAQSEVLTALGGVLRGSPSEPARDALLAVAQLSAEPMSKEAGDALDALDALAAIRDPAAAAKLLRLLGHRDPLRRARAVAALGTLLAVAPTAGLVDALSGVIAQEGDPRVVAEAAWGLGELSATRAAALVPRAAAALRQGLSRRGDSPAEAAVRANALAALARLGNAELVDAFWLTDPSPAVRANATWLVGALQSRSPGMGARLRNLGAVDPDHHVRQSAAAALAGRHPAPLAVRTHWLGMYQVDYDHRPLANARYRLVLPDGLVRVGVTDHRGIARQELLPEGDCELETVPEGEGGR